RWSLGGIFVLASCVAAVALLVFASRHLLNDAVGDGKLRVKGESKVWVYWERQGEVRQLEPGVALQNGDRVRVEVLAAEDVTGYLAVRSSEGVLLGAPAQIRENAIKLKAGEKSTFSGSIKLV